MKFNTIQNFLYRWMILLSSTLAVSTMQAQDLCVPVGWATQSGGVTGGGTATPTVVSTYASFKSAVENSSVKVIHVSGTITFPAAGRIAFQDQTGKSILGLPGAKLVSADQTKDGSGIFNVKRCTNIIIRNLIFEGPGAYDTDGWDLMVLDNCTRVWVDHCEFNDGVDGNLDIKTASDLISITWCIFSYKKPPRSGGPGGANDHRYSNLFGSSDGATGDEGKLRITMQYNWWGEGCRERMPRVRYGKIHMVNNYFSSSVANHGIRAGFKADILAEGNFFVSGFSKPIDEFEGNYTAILSRNNTGASNLTRNTVFTPPYSINIASSTSIVTPIQNCAGAKLSSPTGCSSCGSGSTPAATLTKQGTGAASQSVVVNQAIVGFNYLWANATSATVSGLPNGITATVNNTAKTVTFSGSPTQTGTFNYTVNTTGGSPNASATGTFTVTTTANQAPTVSITSPSNNASFSAPASITINANAADANGTISNVQFFNGTTLLGSDNTSPYSFVWNNVAAGSYTITAVATDNQGTSATSSAISIVVNGASGGETTLTKRGSGSATQSINLGQAITGFYYEWTNATSASVTGMPTGITAVVDNTAKTITFSGTPTQSGTFSFTATTIGGTPTVSRSGTITVTGTANVDCNGVTNGTAFLDECNVCVGGNTGKAACAKDCNNVFGGTASIDQCGVCAGGTTGKIPNSTCSDCNGVINGTATRDECGVCIGGNTGFKACKASLQAETVCSVDGIANESTNAGFTGTGYVNSDNIIGATASWILNSTSSQSVTITFRYANGGTTNRSADVYVSGTSAGQLVMTPTGAWTTWQLATITIALNTGSNEVSLEANGADGLANIDILYFSEGVSDAACVITGVDKALENGLEIYPNPTHDDVNLSTSTAWSLYNTVGEEIAKGEGTTINMGAHASGVYFLKSAIRVVKLVKE